MVWVRASVGKIIEGDMEARKNQACNRKKRAVPKSEFVFEQQLRLILPAYCAEHFI
jgi:hypothetical protein